MKFKKKEVSIGVKKPFIVWVICLSLFILLIILDISLKDTAFKVLLNNSIVPLLVLGIVLGGIIAFIIFIVTSIKFLIKKQNLKKKHFLIKILRFVSIIALLPLFLIINSVKTNGILKSIRNKDAKSVKDKVVLKNLGFAILLILFLLPIWGLGYFVAGYVPAYMVGLVSEPVPMTGESMYPTLPKGDNLQNMKRYPNGIRIMNISLFGHDIERGDIIIAENEKIRKSTKELHGESSGIVKRVIALPGDKVLIKDGLVYLNGKVLKEPYIARSRSTFGGEFLRDCNELKIPENKLFIMGDNRKASGDSRNDTGLIDYKDIQYVLPYGDQLGKLDKGWRDTKDDYKESARITLNADKYLELLNKERAKAGLKPLKYEKRLELSAKIRGENILEYDDFSYEATRSGYTQVKAMNSIGYSNIVWNEGIVQGSYEAEELIKYLSESADWKKNLLGVKDYQDFGISAVHGIANGCPTQVIVQHFAGYAPPNYTKETIDSWGRIINNIEEILPSWEKMKNWQNVNRNDLDKLLGLLYRRKNNAEAIYYRMKANQWLTSKEEVMVNEDKNLYDQIEALAKKLNGQ